MRSVNYGRLSFVPFKSYCLLAGVIVKTDSDVYRHGTTWRTNCTNSVGETSILILVVVVVVVAFVVVVVAVIVEADKVVVVVVVDWCYLASVLATVRTFGRETSVDKSYKPRHRLDSNSNHRGLHLSPQTTAPLE